MSRCEGIGKRTSSEDPERKNVVIQNIGRGLPSEQSNFSKESRESVISSMEGAHGTTEGDCGKAQNEC